MPTFKAYLAEPQKMDGQATILDLILGDKPSVRLDRTYFHPQGGGQKGDRGFIGTVVVIDTKHGDEGMIDHFVESHGDLTIGQTINMRVDASSRLVNAANHSAGHLIAALVDRTFPQIKAVQGHHWPGEARVEFEGSLSDELVAEVRAFLQPALDKALSERWPITLCGDPFKSRSIRVGDGEQVPCGGTHVAHLGQIKKILVKSLKKKNDRLPITYDTDVDEKAI